MTIDNQKILTVVMRARGGDTEAFGVLYSEYLTPLYRYVLARVRVKSVAEDLVQDVFVKAFRLVSKRSDEQVREYSFLSFLFTIAGSGVRDYWRKKKEVVTDGEILIGISDAQVAGNSSIENDIAQKLDEEKLSQGVMSALEELSGLAQNVIVMRFVNDLSVAEVAQILGKSTDAIRQIQSRAIKALRLIISKDGYNI